jgi:hypothetical protein
VPDVNPADAAAKENPARSNAPVLSIADAIAAANAWFVRAALLHSAASQLVADFAGEEPKYHIVGAFGVERRVPPEQLEVLVGELRAAVASARAEAERMLGGGVLLETAKDIPSLTPEATVSVAPQPELLPQLDECILFNTRSSR